MALKLRWSWVLTLGALGACVAGQGQGPNGPGAAGAQRAQAAFSLEGAVLPRRLARPVPDPKPGAKVKVARYWAFGGDAPFEISRVEVRNDPPGSGPWEEVLTLEGDVQVLSAQALKQGKAKWRLAQADGEDDSADEAASSSSGVGDEAAPGPASLPTPSASLGQSDGAESGDLVAEDRGGDGAEGAADLDGAAEGDLEDLWAPDDGGMELALDEPLADEEDWAPLDEAGDDVPDEGEDFVEVGTDGQYSPSDPASTLVVPRDQLKGILGQPHRVTMAIHAPPVMSDLEGEITFKDASNGASMQMTYSFGSQRVRFACPEGTLTLDRNPDGTVMVDGQGATNMKEVAKLGRGSKLMEGKYLAMFNLLLARLDRMGPPKESRGRVTPPLDDSRFGDSLEDQLAAKARNEAVHAANPVVPQSLGDLLSTNIRTLLATPFPIVLPAGQGKLTVLGSLQGGYITPKGMQ